MDLYKWDVSGQRRPLGLSATAIHLMRDGVECKQNIRGTAISDSRRNDRCAGPTEGHAEKGTGIHGMLGKQKQANGFRLSRYAGPSLMRAY
jgi:hypothetical protein